VNPARQAKAHDPLWQTVWKPPDGAEPQALPQAPQFAGSLAVSTQTSPQRTCPDGHGGITSGAMHRF
jgi:hypothetical protein